MKKIFTIARKEFTDIIRDRRTLITMIIVPLLLFPLIVNITATVQRNQMKKSRVKVLKVGIIDKAGAEDLVKRISDTENLTAIIGGDEMNPQELIQSDSLDAVVKIAENFLTNMDSMRTGSIELFYKAIDDESAKRRVMNPIDAYKDNELAKRLMSLDISHQAINPIQITDRNVATKKEIIGKLAGGFLPYIFILFCFFGCFYPAIDLFTGEKERGTLETILTLPVNRLQILFGKMIVVAVSGFLSALLALTGLIVSLNLIEGIPDEIFSILQGMVNPISVILLLALLLPISIFFAGMLIPISSQAKSFKEAQSKITPMNFMVIIPAALGLMPGIELNYGTALIPILNVALATKEIIAGTIDYSLYAVVFASLILLAILAISLSVRGFSKESNITT